MEARDFSRVRLHGYIPFKDYGDEDETLHLMTLYESGSRSYFGETSNELRRIGKSVTFSDLSEEIQKEYPDLQYAYSFMDEDHQTEASYTVIDKAILDIMTPKGHQYYSVLHKDTIAAYEAGEIESMYPDDEDLSSKTPEEMKCYQYYEWDDPTGWFHGFKIIRDALEHEINKYGRNTFYYLSDVRIVLFVL